MRELANLFGYTNYEESSLIVGGTTELIESSQIGGNLALMHNDGASCLGNLGVVLILF